MAASKIAKIVRSVVGRQATIYNDKLANGVRSIKLDMWARDVGGVYELQDRAQWTRLAAAHLTAAGYKVDIVTTHNGDTRLHVA